jgi:AraC-like DNA-binding protein
MVWTAVREQLEAPPCLAPQDLRRARIKSFIEAQLDDPDLSVESIARSFGMSVRSLHRAFAADPAGSVSKYVWIRRLDRCAAELRDPRQAHRPITEICFSWGFNSTSHFSRLFRQQFGFTPRDYRRAIEEIGSSRNSLAGRNPFSSQHTSDPQPSRHNAKHDAA